MTEYEILQLAHRTCWKYKVGANPLNKTENETYTFNKETILEFVRILKLMEKPNGSA